jgi:hypothetical protein
VCPTDARKERNEEGQLQKAAAGGPSSVGGCGRCEEIEKHGLEIGGRVSFGLS